MFSFVHDNIDFAHKLDNSTTPSENFERHMHYFNEILFFVSGDVNYTVESETHKLEPGDIVLIPSGKYHFATINLSVPYERYVLKFPDQIIPPSLVCKKNKQFSFFSNTKKYFLSFQNLDEYYENFADKDDVYALFVCELVKLLVMLCRETSTTETKQNEIITKIINYIDENIHNNISLDSLSEAFSFSKSYISNEFKKHMKTPIMQYVRFKKIIAAHSMILNGYKKTTVAELFGFENYSTFYREYIKIMGSTPNGKNK